MIPALYPCLVVHRRRGAVEHTVRHRTYLWLIDPDEPPRPQWWLRPLAGFRARDHFDGTAPTIRAGLDRFLADRGVFLEGGRVTMLCHARVLGYVFNPLTLYWCRDRAGRLRCVVAEVHNTYHGRHCYLLEPDERDRARTAKEFYVSPFLPAEGHYTMRLPEPDERLSLSVRLELPDHPPFTAGVAGHRRQPTSRNLLSAAVRHPWSTLAVSAAIRLHGLRLLLRGLSIQPRSADTAGSQRASSPARRPRRRRSPHHRLADRRRTKESTK
ncbi:DUF1365 domain-containing protein [Streptomyces alkaliterrae]|uniref:DUF1365 domain-containing protein n=1 Tax=Streptomyces alkaliterrae TaxID=2213162 RepID=A0A5P0YK21_9ACTN|nr:DUF1365 domain-containing protein [Streptomyces alkaliterrae]MBB1257707.1 DUF1365 domain-containing protein [Streptomyces alkaliterrae]MQS00646.1 DUF1365 family protein [Streptomyces alkaliterrae]